MILTTLIDGVRETRELTDGTYFVGRGESCRIRFASPDVSERHAILTVRGSRVLIEDLHSANGTFVNGVAIDRAEALDGGKVVQVGSGMLRVSEEPAAEAAGPDKDARDAATEAADGEGGGRSESDAVGFDDAAREPSADRPEFASGASPEAAEPPSAPVDDPMRALRRSVQKQIQHELLKRMDMKKLTVQGVDREGLEENARAKIRAIIDEVVANGRLPEGIDPVRLEDDVFNEAMRLGPLEDLLADDSVSEIMVNGPAHVYVERHGKLALSDCQFSDDASVMAVIERIIAPLGRRCDESQPYVDARLPDGSRVNAIIAPLALSGPTITIRKFAKKALTPEDFIRFGTWTHDAAKFMRLCVTLRKNIIVAGGTGSGKTTLLNLLSGFIPATERIITVEDAAELRLQQPHVVRLEARPANIEGKGAVPIRDLVKNCLRMRPDRIIVGECRGAEALDMLQAMNTGHDGSMTTCHANNPRDALSRLENMVMMAGFELPSAAIREQIASAIHLIVQQTRLPDGSRKIVKISEVTGREGNTILLQDIFTFEQEGFDENFHVIGRHTATGNIPTFVDELRQAGDLELDMSVFVPEG